MRIVGGSLRGRRLVAPYDTAIRPTADRVRESIFNILAHGIEGFTLEGAQVIDLFAGTGALGCEALSRGAAFCLFVEQDASARGIIRENIEAFGLSGITRLYRRDATDLGPANKRDIATLAFLDPPYGKGLAEKTLTCLSENGWLADDAIVVVEEHATADITLPPSYTQLDHRTYGETQVAFARRITAK